MKIGFASRSGALWLALSSVLSLLLRSYYDIRYSLVEEFSGRMPMTDVYWFLGFTLIVGGHMAALLTAAGYDSRVGWSATFVFSLINGLGFGAASLLAYTSNTLEVVTFSLSLITGLLAAAAAWRQIRTSRAAAPATG